ncbi:putative CBL-interacting serine/threonine-protein kinase 8 [Monocercomonoides exilis]|uniref:putative CBL-interacting serine/threonine-protein kinase 8 n=1 Tax=Monocercomonoides exilis TaxID=2049356 RepID=UPI0035596E71|nr:putative CBL-interacting serine/threonine-protein kinase 8 [Monocercomonoides exilis]|eukprot:MONOS_2412.1-p1 / transcript=MONOS_2412.1 / gene=MONOS_2412 / organism=Monocercomonoides_exilis_PA203 / gene_product=Os01g0536000 / transcript_product=Os01g0536000 / location=Mono_scaffold00049:145139-148275(-) / protein_length=832 / sequence_SO=supercontig / SO=protein_coding / is_pseudo=false
MPSKIKTKIEKETTVDHPMRKHNMNDIINHSSSKCCGRITKVNKYQIGPTLGEGTFGKVKQARNVFTGEIVAMKILNKERILKRRMADQLKREISLMKKLRHENVVQLIEVLTSKTKIFIVLELAVGGELFQKIAHAQHFTESIARYYFQQLIQGVEFCHECGICHRDLKPENLLLDDMGRLKISDFGLCALTGKDDVLLRTQCGTPNYTAPEILSGNPYDGKPADVWSCGVILFVMLAGYLPFEENATTELFNKIKKAQYEFPPYFPEAPKSLIKAILVPDPSKRLTIPQIKEHPWFRGERQDTTSQNVSSLQVSTGMANSAIGSSSSSSSSSYAPPPPSSSSSSTSALSSSSESSNPPSFESRPDPSFPVSHPLISKVTDAEMAAAFQQIDEADVKFREGLKKEGATAPHSSPCQSTPIFTSPSVPASVQSPASSVIPGRSPKRSMPSSRVLASDDPHALQSSSAASTSFEVHLSEPRTAQMLPIDSFPKAQPCFMGFSNSPRFCPSSRQGHNFATTSSPSYPSPSSSSSASATSTTAAPVDCSLQFQSPYFQPPFPLSSSHDPSALHQSAVPKPASMNVFDLISASGALDISPILKEPRKKKSKESLDDFSLPSETIFSCASSVPAYYAYFIGSGSIPLFPSDSLSGLPGLPALSSSSAAGSDSLLCRKRIPITADIIMQRVADELVKFSQSEVKLSAHSPFKVRFAMPGAAGAMTATVELLRAAEQVFLVEVRRGRGGVLDFMRWYRQLRIGLGDIAPFDGEEAGGLVKGVCESGVGASEGKYMHPACPVQAVDRVPYEHTAAASDVALASCQHPSPSAPSRSVHHMP